MTADSYEDVVLDKGSAVPALEVPPQDLYHAKSFWTRWIFCQDAKVIAIQYSITAISIGLVALVLSWLMRLQLAFPELLPFLGAAEYYQLPSIEFQGCHRSKLILGSLHLPLDLCYRQSMCLHIQYHHLVTNCLPNQSLKL